MTDAQREELKRVLRVFGKGCIHAGQDSEGSPARISANPADCEECLNNFVDVIVPQYVFGEKKQ